MKLLPDAQFACTLSSSLLPCFLECPDIYKLAPSRLPMPFLLYQENISEYLSWRFSMFSSSSPSVLSLGLLQLKIVNWLLHMVYTHFHFCMWTSTFSSVVCWRDWTIISPLCSANIHTKHVWPVSQGFGYGLSSLCHWSTFSPLRQCHTTLTTATL